MQERLEEQVDVNVTPKQRDRLFMRLSKGFTHASQVVPCYGEFCLGHGDPLMKAALDYERNQTHANLTPKTPTKSYQRGPLMFTLTKRYT